MNLREEHGYTYGAQSVFTFRKGPGPFYVFSPVRTDVTAPALEEIFLELREAVSRPIAGEELQRAKDSLVLSLPGGFQTSAGLAAQYANVHVYGLGLDYFGGYADQIVAERYVTPDEMIVVAAGDRAQIESALADLDLGPLEIFEDR
jgi:zinc protease